jgi:hypothetical protein
MACCSAAEEALSFVFGNVPLLQMSRQLRDGEPCGHPGCLQHISHPCEGCGRTVDLFVYKPKYTDQDQTAGYRVSIIVSRARIDSNLETFHICGHWEGNTFVPDKEDA